MNSKIDFSDPRSVASSAEIETAKRRIERTLKTAQAVKWPFIAVLFLSVMWLTWKAVSQEFSTFMILDDLHKLAVGCGVAFVSCGVLEFHVIEPWLDRLEFAKARLRPLELWEIEKAAELCAKHPELESWRISIAEKREFVLGDLHAMECWASQRDEKIQRAENDRKYLAAKQALHDISPVKVVSSAMTLALIKGTES